MTTWLARHRTLVAIVAFGLLLRLLYAYVLVRSQPLVGDAVEFQQQANLLASGHGFIEPLPFALHGISVASADKPPLYPLLEAGFSLFGFRSWPSHDLVGILAGTATIAVCYALGAAVAGRRAGLIAAGLCAVYPLLIASDGSLRSESLFALMVTLALLAALRARQAPTRRRLALLGVLVALAALTRGEGLLLVLLVPWAAGRRALPAAVGLAACALVLAPWFIRCWLAFDQPVLISNNVGGLLAGANCPTTYHGPLLGQWDSSCIRQSPELNEAVEAGRLRRDGLRYAGDHLSRLPAVFAARLGRSFELFRPAQGWVIERFFEGRDETVDQIGVYVWWVVAPLALLGAALLRRRGGPWGLLLAPLGMVAFVSVTAYGITRFRVAAEPAIIVLAAIALEATALRGRQRWAARSGAL